MQNAKENRDAAVTRSGHVALVGRPNVGKSTLLNALVGERLSIVTPRPQTTRETVTGILTRPDCQVVFVDTPGLMDVSYLLHEAMLHSARSALEQADVVLLLLDGQQPDDVPPANVLDLLRARRGRLVVAVNKVDAASPTAVAKLADWAVRELEVMALAISAEKGDGLELLMSMVVERLPESPYLYPADEIATQPLRFFVEELVRETVFEVYGQEVPYSTAIRIEEYREGEDPVFIRAVIYVERESQRGIVIGQGGARIRELGTRSRKKIEAFTGERVYLDLWVKTLPGWRRKAESLKRLGYNLPGPRKAGR